MSSENYDCPWNVDDVQQKKVLKNRIRIIDAFEKKPEAIFQKLVIHFDKLHSSILKLREELDMLEAQIYELADDLFEKKDHTAKLVALREDLNCISPIINKYDMLFRREYTKNIAIAHTQLRMREIISYAKERDAIYFSKAADGIEKCFDTTKKGWEGVLTTLNEVITPLYLKKQELNLQVYSSALRKRFARVVNYSE